MHCAPCHPGERHKVVVPEIPRRARAWEAVAATASLPSDHGCRGARAQQATNPSIDLTAGSNTTAMARERAQDD